MRNGLNRGLLSMLLLWVLSACTAVPPPYEEPPLQPQQKEKPVPIVVSPCVQMLSYYEILKLMSVEELKQREAALWQSVNHTGNSCDQLRLSVLLSLPEFRLENDVKAEKLIKDFLEKQEEPTIQDKQIAWLLVDEIKWRKQIQSKQQLLKKQQKKERIACSDLLEQLSEAQLKLKQLRNIDKNINAKEQEISIPSTDKMPSDSK